MNKFLIIASVLEIGLAFICVFFGVLVISISIANGLHYIHRTPYIQFLLGPIGLLAFAFGLASGIFMLKKTRFSLAISGSFAIITWTVIFIVHILLNVPRVIGRIPWLMLAFFMIVFAILSLIFTIVSRKDFSKSETKRKD